MRDQMTRSIPTAFVYYLALASILLCCNGKSSNPASTSQPSQLDREVIGTWRYALPWNKDTTFNIIMSFDSTLGYRIGVNINGTDTMEKETGTWSVASDSASKRDSVWMDRVSCRQINLTTNMLDSVDCGIDRAGIRLNIDDSGAWEIPLGDFVKYLPSDIAQIASALQLPQVAFVKDPL